MTEWWDPSTGNIIGALLGAGLGSICGIYGGVGGALAPKGLLRGPVLATHSVLLAIGIACLITSLVALAIGQPWSSVAFPLFLPGLVVTAVMGPLLPVVRTRYNQADQRRFDAEEIRRS